MSALPAGIALAAANQVRLLASHRIRSKRDEKLLTDSQAVQFELPARFPAVGGERATAAAVGSGTAIDIGQITAGSVSMPIYINQNFFNAKQGVPVEAGGAAALRTPLASDEKAAANPEQKALRSNYTQLDFKDKFGAYWRFVYDTRPRFLDDTKPQPHVVWMVLADTVYYLTLQNEAVDATATLRAVAATGERAPHELEELLHPDAPPLAAGDAAVSAGSAGATAAASDAGAKDIAKNHTVLRTAHVTTGGSFTSYGPIKGGGRVVVYGNDLPQPTGEQQAASAQARALVIKAAGESGFQELHFNDAVRQTHFTGFEPGANTVLEFKPAAAAASTAAAGAGAAGGAAGAGGAGAGAAPAQACAVQPAAAAAAAAAQPAVAAGQTFRVETALNQLNGAVNRLHLTTSGPIDFHKNDMGLPHNTPHGLPKPNSVIMCPHSVSFSAHWTACEQYRVVTRGPATIDCTDQTVHAISCYVCAPENKALAAPLQVTLQLEDAAQTVAGPFELPKSTTYVGVWSAAAPLRSVTLSSTAAGVPFVAHTIHVHTKS